MKEMVTIILTPMRYFSHIDEDFMFEWLDRIESVESYKGIGRELHVQIKSKQIPSQELCELMGLFKRYKIRNIKQLEVFKNETNKEWFDA